MNSVPAPSSAQSTGFGIIGTGHIAANFAEDLRLLGDVRLRSVLSRTRASAEAFKTAHGAVRAHNSIDDFLNDPELQVIYIASPNGAHAEQALTCLRAKKAVLIEKPFAVTDHEAVRIAGEAKRQGVPAMEAMWIRFLPGILKARALLQGDVIGDVVSVKGDLAYQHSYDPKSRFFDKALGGGVSLDLAIYLLSLTIFFFGKPAGISGSWRAAESGVDISADYLLSYDRFQAELTASFERRGGNAYQITGTKGTIRIEDPFIQARAIRMLRGRGALSKILNPNIGAPMGMAQKIAARLPLPGQTRHQATYQGTGLQFQARAIADAVRSGDTSGLVPLEESAAALRAVNLILSAPPQRQLGQT